jgi:ribosome-associated protein
MSELLKLVQKTLDDKLAMNIVTIDMQAVSPFTDYFVICTAKNIRHAQSLAEFLEQEAAKNDYDVRIREGEKDSTWVLIDLNEVVVHIFTEETRKMYRLEALWADQPQEPYVSSQA